MNNITWVMPEETAARKLGYVFWKISTAEEGDKCLHSMLAVLPTGYGKPMHNHTSSTPQNGCISHAANTSPF